MVNRYCQAWDKHNVFVFGAGNFVQNTQYNPTGMVGGLATWIAIAGSDLADPVMAMARPIGKLSLDALTMTVVPLVFALLATGIAGAAEGASGRVARHAML